MKSPAGRSCWNIAFAGAVLVLAAACGGCMKDAAQLRVDAISKWHEDHAAPLGVLVEARAKASVAGARERIRHSLQTTRLELESQMRGSALEQLATCGTNVEAKCDVKKAKEEVATIEAQLSRTETDRINRVGDRAKTFQLGHKLKTAQKRYWDLVSQHRSECAQAVREDLADRLTALNGKFLKVVSKTTDRFSRRLRWEWRACAGAVEHTLDDLAEHINALRKCKSWRPSECKAPDAIGKNRRWNFPMYRCDATIGRAHVLLDEKIDAAKRSLEQGDWNIKIRRQSTQWTKRDECAATSREGGG